MEKIKQVAVAGLLILVGLAAWGAVLTALNPEGTTEPSAAAKENTFKNSFISGCVQEPSDYITPEESQAYCSCGYDELIQMYPDFATNEVRLNRILAEGYNQDETDIMVRCLP